MKLIIAGSRSIRDIRALHKAIEVAELNPDVIISGGARGVDKLGEQYAKENIIPLEIYPAEWDKYGKSAGYKRNAIMAEKGDELLVLWDGKSPGTKHMIKTMKEKNKPVYAFIVDKDKRKLRRI